MPTRPTVVTVDASAAVLSAIIRLRATPAGGLAAILTRPVPGPVFTGDVNAPDGAFTLEIAFEGAGGDLTALTLPLPRGAGAHRLLLHLRDDVLPGPPVPPPVVFAGHSLDQDTIPLIAGHLEDLADAIRRRDIASITGQLAVGDPAVSQIIAALPMCMTSLVEVLLEVARRQGPAAYDRVVTALSAGWQPGLYRTYYTLHEGRAELFVIRHMTAGVRLIPPTDTSAPVAVPGTNGLAVVGATGANGIPDVVERVAIWLHRALDLYAGERYGLLPPLGPIEVRLSSVDDYAFSGDGFIDLPGLASDDKLAVHVAHELTHHMQRRYEARGRDGSWFAFIREGGAMFAEDVVLDPCNRYIGALTPGVYAGLVTLAAEPHRSLFEFHHPSGQFHKYVSEQRSTATAVQDEPAVGVETQRRLLEAADRHGYERIALEKAIESMPWYQAFDRFSRLANGDGSDLLSAETLVGNFRVAAAFVDGAGFPPGEARFRFKEADQAFLENPAAAPFMPAAAQAHLGAITHGGGGLTAGDPNLAPDAARYYRIDVDPGVDTFALGVAGGSGVVQAVLVQDDGTVRDVHRSDAGSWARRFTSPRGPRRIARVLLIVTSRASPRAFVVQAEEAEAASDLMITRWNTRAGRHCEIDPARWQWTWTSPDVWIDNGTSADPDPRIVPGADNRLFVRLHNHGLRDASGVTIRAHWQRATGDPQPSGAWWPVMGAGGTLAFAAPVVPAGSTVTFEIPWRVPLAEPGSIPHCLLRVRVTAPDDPNADGKSCLTALGCVDVVDGRATLDLMRYPRGADDAVETFAVERGAGRLFVPLELIAGISALRPTPVAAGGTGPRIDSIPVDILPQPIERVVAPATHAGGRARPDAALDNPPDPETLPPPAANQPLVTIMQTSNGRVIGGYTFIVRGAGSVRPTVAAPARPQPPSPIPGAAECPPPAPCDPCPALRALVDVHRRTVQGILAGR
jgi:hypothetical protein